MGKLGARTALRRLLRHAPPAAMGPAARIRRLLGHVPRSQSNEAEILVRLVEQLDAPRSFLEFGFSPFELNCAMLLQNCSGLLIDGDPRNVEAAHSVMPPEVRAMQVFLDLDNLHVLTEQYRPGELGVLSIDVDGNDYWFLEALLPELQPTIVAVEYNASFGLRPIVVPYDATFDRHEKHPSGWYHGASLEALTRLSARGGYRLVAVAAAGTNAFYVRKDPDALPTLGAADAYRENTFRNRWSGTTAVEQWERIEELPYVTVG